MKKTLWIFGCLSLVLFSPETGRSDLLKKELRSSDGNSSTTGYVYQEGSSSRTSNRSSSRRDPVIPSNSKNIRVTPMYEFTEAPAPQTSGPKPRFGYGSDYKGETEPKGKEVVPAPTAPQPRDEPVPPAQYPDSDIPSVPSYSDPRPAPPQTTSPSNPQAPIYRDGEWRYGERSPVPDSYANPQEPLLENDYDSGVPFPFDMGEVFGMREVGEGIFPFGIPQIEFRVDPPVHREFWPVIPHFFDPHCAPRVPTPFHSHGHPNLPIPGEFPVPFFFPFGR